MAGSQSLACNMLFDGFWPKANPPQPNHLTGKKPASPVDTLFKVNKMPSFFTQQ
ncbi:hypothetical protein [Methylomonas koyamae]|uniref:hypothetical protein n=1 Tax=Methylomonas koyamae TaxID=702114 RepID=UPI0018E09051|nr:hypothetical protein [Methylomonas koyamae]